MTKAELGGCIFVPAACDPDITKQPLVAALLEDDKQPFLQTQNSKISSS